MRPLRGGQGTFDRIIENLRRISGRCKIAIGGNFDESSVDSFPALLDFLREQPFRRPAGQGELQAGGPGAASAPPAGGQPDGRSGRRSTPESDDGQR